MTGKNEIQLNFWSDGMNSKWLVLLSFMVVNYAVAQTTKESHELMVKEPSGSVILDRLSEPADLDLSIKVIVEKKQTIEEYRQKGELVLVKVIPNDGVPYYIDPMERDNIKGSGSDLINSGVKPVRWVLKEF